MDQRPDDIPEDAWATLSEKDRRRAVALTSKIAEERRAVDEKRDMEERLQPEIDRLESAAQRIAMMAGVDPSNMRVDWEYEKHEMMIRMDQSELEGIMSKASFELMRQQREADRQEMARTTRFNMLLSFLSLALAAIAIYVSVIKK